VISLKLGHFSKNQKQLISHLLLFFLVDISKKLLSIDKGEIPLNEKKLSLIMLLAPLLRQQEKKLGIAKLKA
jgi:hypothetical protein